MRIFFSRRPARHLISFLFLLTLSLASSAQENPDGKLANDTLYLNSGAKFTKGDKIQLGYGSNGAKGFEFIYVSTRAWAAAGTKLPSNWSKLTMVIKKIEMIGTKKLGYKFFLFLGADNMVNYQCDIVSAIEQKEVVIKGIKEASTASNGSSPSLADELKKLKDLLDAGAITQKEYDEAKKKILAN